MSITVFRSKASKILIDALFDRPNPAYRAPSPDALEKMVDGAAPFDGVKVALVTHNHPDHFDARAAAGGDRRRGRRGSRSGRAAFDVAQAGKARLCERELRPFKTFGCAVARRRHLTRRLCDVYNDDIDVPFVDNARGP